MFNHSSGMNCINGFVNPYPEVNLSPEFGPNKLFPNEINIGDTRLY